MIYQIVCSLLFLNFFISTVNAHSIIASVNGEKQCLRAINDLVHENFPINNVNSDDMMCNVLGKNDDKSATPCSLTAGEAVTMTWFDRNEKVIHPGHKGPCAAYISRPGTNKWAKIWEEGFRDGKWCTDRLIESNGAMTFNLPKELADGKWLLRGEIIALHVAHNEGGAQFYMRCADIVVTNGGGQEPATNVVPIPGYLTAKDPGVLYSLYKDVIGTDYVVPGPPITTFGKTTSDSSSLASIKAPEAKITVPDGSVGQESGDSGKDEKVGSASSAGPGDASVVEPKDKSTTESGDIAKEKSTTDPGEAYKAESNSSSTPAIESQGKGNEQSEDTQDSAAKESTHQEQEQQAREKAHHEKVRQEQIAREKAHHEKVRQEQIAREKAHHEQVRQQQQHQKRCLSVNCYTTKQSLGNVSPSMN